MTALHRPSPINIILAFPLCFAMMLLVSGVNRQLQSASLSSVSVTSSNPRPSFRGALAAGNILGSSTVLINTTPNVYPSTSSAQLVEGDSLMIGEAGSLGSYTVASTSSLSTIFITGALASGDIDTGDDVIATNSANLTTRFTTVSAVPDGRFRVLVPALADATAASDGIPDGGAFDKGSGVGATVTCPGNVAGQYTFVAGTATASAITIGSNTYHSFECAYSGSGAVGTPFDGTTQGAIVLNSLINPAPKPSHTTGVADTYNVIVQQLDSALNVQDSTTVSIAVIEAVRITASVPPQITFQILGLPTGTSACGLNTNVSTTATSVPFGEISISSFTNAAQAMTISTNAIGGYVVTAQENDQMGRNGAACTGTPTVAGDPDCIPDALGNNGTMTPSASDEWTNATISNGKGLGYSLDDVNTSGLTPAFQYDTVGGGCSGTYCARQFADAENSETPVTIFSNSTVADNQNLYVCYKVVAGTTTSAGNFENYVIYNATATF